MTVAGIRLITYESRVTDRCGASGQGCSVTGGYVYRGRSILSAHGRYFYGDYCSGTIWSMPATGGALRVEPVKVPQLTSFGQSLDGNQLYVVSQSGTVSRFVR